MSQRHRDLLKIPLVFCLIFVGDYAVCGVYLYYIFFLFFIIYRHSRLSRRTLRSSAFLLLLFLDVLFKEVAQDGSVSKIFILISAPIWLDYSMSISEKTHENKFWTLSLSLIAFFVSIHSISMGVTRGSFIFGPNILYRVYFFLGALSLYVWSQGKILTSLVLRVQTLLSLISTGSRTSLLLFPFLFRIQKMRKWYLFLLAPLIYILIQLSNPRLMNFTGVEGGYRHLAFIKLINWSDYITTTQLLFGSSSVNPMYSFYPHNIFLEVIVEHGLFRLPVLVFGYFMFIKHLVKGLPVLHFLGIFVGSLVSGSLFENFLVYVYGIHFLSYDSRYSNYR